MFFNSYNKPGKGVNKRDPNQPRMTTFFEILPRKIWPLCKANMLHLLTAIPFFVVTMIVMGIISSKVINLFSTVFGEEEFGSTLMILDVVMRWFLAILFTVFFGQGPVTAGVTYIIRNYAREEHCWPVSDFFEKTKENFKQSICLWIIDLIFLYVATVAFVFYWTSANYILAFLLIWVAIIYIVMHIYIYQIMITFDLPLKHVVKNSFIFTFSNAPKNLLLLLIVVAVHMVLPYIALFCYSDKAIIVLLVWALLELILLPALTSFMTNFFIYPSIEKYINLANENKNLTD